MSGSAATPEVSVVLACHGNAERLPDTLESVLAQEGVALECLLVSGEGTSCNQLLPVLAETHRVRDTPCSDLSGNRQSPCEFDA